MTVENNKENLEKIGFEDFMRVELRVGTILEASVNEKALKPAYILTIDFGDFGVRKSSAQIIRNYSTEHLLGKQVVAVMNFPPKVIAGFKSEILVLGAYSECRDVVLLGMTKTVENGSRVA